MAILNPLYANELEMMEDLHQMDESVKERFRIVDLNSLNWALRKMIAIDVKKRELNESIDNEIQRLEGFRKQEVGKLQDSEDFFRSLISEYALHKRDTDPDFKSLKTPYGTIGYRKQQPKWNYNDATLINYLKAAGLVDLVRTKEEPVKTEIKKLFKVHDDGRVFDENGQAVDGIIVEYVPETLDIKLSEV